MGSGRPHGLLRLLCSPGVEFLLETLEETPGAKSIVLFPAADRIFFSISIFERISSRLRSNSSLYANFGKLVGSHNVFGSEVLYCSSVSIPARFNIVENRLGFLKRDFL